MIMTSSCDKLNYQMLCAVKHSWLLAFCLIFLSPIVYSLRDVHNHTNDKSSSVLVIMPVRNKAHALPYFFGFFEKINYPKDKVSFWVQSDHNIDNSSAILLEWAKSAKKVYKDVIIEVENYPSGYPGERGPLDWTDQRFEVLLKIRQNGLDFARENHYDFALFIDADIFIENPDTLSALINQNRTIVGPKLNVTEVSSLYSNFWGAADEEGYYKRSEDYLPIVFRHIQGCFPVHVVHSCFLVNLKHDSSNNLTFYPVPPQYRGAYDDIIITAHVTQLFDMKMHILNTEFFGHMTVPLTNEDSLNTEIEVFRHAKTEVMVNGASLAVSEFISPTIHDKDKLDFDEVYLINLERRPDRLKRVSDTLHELGVDFHLVYGVDGKKLNHTYLNQNRIEMLPEYADPYSRRILTWGEIGCFMSHYNIWLQALEQNYSRILILEDDARFLVFFREKLRLAIQEADVHVPDWDLLYLGRKILKRNEHLVFGTESLAWPSYTYWTVAYAVTRAGMKKLINGRPLEKMVAIDEYLPIMFDKHDNKKWMSYFPNRDVVAISVNPLIIQPTHFVGEDSYFSDTETSSILSEPTVPESPTNPETPTDPESPTVPESPTDPETPTDPVSAALQPKDEL